MEEFVTITTIFFLFLFVFWSSGNFIDLAIKAWMLFMSVFGIYLLYTGVN